jgi:hypothetical protein
MKPKTLSKKIRRLEARQQKDARKLAKLKQKLAAAKARRKLSAGTSGTPAKARQKGGRPTAKPASGAKRSAGKKVKRKLNLSPERRAQLAAAMKARWAAKRAAAETPSKKTSTDGDFTIGETPQAM